MYGKFLCEKWTLKQHPDSLKIHRQFMVCRVSFCIANELVVLHCGWPSLIPPLTFHTNSGCFFVFVKDFSIESFPC